MTAPSNPVVSVAQFDETGAIVQVSTGPIGAFRDHPMPWIEVPDADPALCRTHAISNPTAPSPKLRKRAKALDDAQLAAHRDRRMARPAAEDILEEVLADIDRTVLGPRGLAMLALLDALDAKHPKPKEG